MLEGIDEAVIVTSDLDRALRLYRDHLEFAVVARARLDDPSRAGLWRLPPGPADVVHLAKRGGTGGGIRLLCPRDVPAAPPRTLHSTGPLALDFYVRDLDGLYRRLREDGFAFRSQPQRYGLFGTSFEVDEVLLEGPEGLLHALVGYLPGRHRCVLGDRADLGVSEVVAAVTVVDDVDDGLALWRDALGGEVYFDEVFRGPVIETLLRLPPGSAFRAALLRGPGRRNARAELMQRVPGRVGWPADRPRRHPRLVLSLVVDRLDHLLPRLAGHGRLRGPLTFEHALCGPCAHATLETPWGAFLELRQRP